MLKPKFTIGNERLFISDKYLTNGHWLIKREAANNTFAPKAFKPLLSCANGTYFNGIKNGRDVETTPEMEQVIPIRDGFLPLSDGPTGVEFRCDEVGVYIFSCGDFEIGINPNYVPIIRMGFAFAKDAHSPILVLSESTLNSDLVAVVMPMRLKKSEGK